VLVEGPDYLHRGDERPRVMKATWHANPGATSVEIAFSTPLRIPPDGTRIGVRLDDGATAYSESCRIAREAALDCRFPALRVQPATSATLLLPGSLASATGQRVTLWASGVPHVELQP